MSKKLFEDFTEVTNYKLLDKVPIIIHFNGRNFKKITKFVEKPFSYELNKCFEDALFKCCLEFEGCVFGYQFNDEFIFILRNNKSKETLAWYDNKIQKILSATTSILTNNFVKNITNMEIVMDGDAVFNGHIFNVASVSDCTNYIIFNQNKNLINALNLACEYELLKLNFNSNYVIDLIQKMSIDEKKEMLLDTCNIDFVNYPQEYRRGVACYRISENNKSKLHLDNNLGIFSENIIWLTSVIAS